jgi:septal ring factor EnvC (AmiA/AmiB activator)
LENEREVNIQKINEAEKILKETENSKTVSIGRLKVINRQINNRQNLIRSLKSDINSQDKEIKSLSNIISSLNNDVKLLTNEYADMIYNSYKSKSSLTQISYVFSSENYNQMFRRMNYLFQYSSFRKSQIDEIMEVKNKLKLKEENLKRVRINKDNLLRSELSENNKLQSLKGRQKKIISDLGRRQDKVRKEIKKRKEALKKIDILIREIIRKESQVSRSDEENIDLERVSSEFESLIGKHNWPVSSGFISNRFGEHPHPVIKSVKVKNDGVDIQTNKSSKVFSIFEGKISTIAFIPGMNNVVIINHGNYFTLYARLKNLKIEKDQVIPKGHIIGDLVTNSDGVTELQFQVWKNNVKLNPEKWIIKK